MFYAGVLFLFAVVAPGLSQMCTGVKIGDLPTHFHKVRGELYVENEYTFCIRNFSYDGLGPDAFLYFYYPGDTNPFDSTGNGVIINITTQSSNRPQFDVNVPYTDEPFYRFTLPMNRFRACDFGGFSIWCRYANQLFTTLAWNYTDVFSAAGGSGTIMCIPSPGRAYAGQLPSNGGGVGGQLYFVSNKTMAIRGFTYNSSSTEVFVYWFAPGVTPSAGSGKIIKLTAEGSPESGAFPVTPITGSEDFMITIPANDNYYTCDMGTFTIWCRTCQSFFTMLPINLELFTNNPLEYQYEPNRLLCNRTTTRPGIYINELPTEDARQVSGSFYVVNQNTFFIQLFSFDTTEYEDVFMYYFPRGVAVTDDGSGGGKIPLSASMSSFGTSKSDSFYNQDLTVDLSKTSSGIKACEIEYFAILSEKTPMVITKIEIPLNVFYQTGEESRDGAVLCDGSQRMVAAYSLMAMLFLLAYVFCN